MLDVKLERGQEIICRRTALNDAVVTSNEGLRVISLDLWVDEHFITTISGDGIIASTPTGSSAYSMSAGGPLVEPEADTILVTPICSHSLFAKSFVLSGSSKVTVKNAAAGTPNTPGLITNLTVDGMFGCNIEYGDKLIVEKSNISCKLIRCKNHGFYSIIRKKLII
jgi:NAD+ kinase